MAWQHERKEITKEDYEAIKAGEKGVNSFFSETQLIGYGACPSNPVEVDGKYYIPYGISDSCD